MSKAMKEPVTPAPIARVNYITPSGLQRLKDQHRFLLTRERPAVTQVVAWAAGNGDRSENADYQYDKRRLRLEAEEAARSKGEEDHRLRRRRSGVPRKW